MKKKKGNAEKKEAAPVQKKQSKNEPKTQETPSAPATKGKMLRNKLKLHQKNKKLLNHKK